MKKGLTVVVLTAAVSLSLAVAGNEAFAGGKGNAGRGTVLRDSSHIGTPIQGTQSTGGGLNTRGRLGDGTQPRPQDGTGFGYGDGTKPRPQDGTGFGASK